MDCNITLNCSNSNTVTASFSLCSSFLGRELEGVNNLSSQILRRCFPTNKLPVSTLSSPLAFALLDLDSAGHSAGEDLMDDSGEGNYNVMLETITLLQLCLSLIHV